MGLSFEQIEVYHVNLLRTFKTEYQPLTGGTTCLLYTSRPFFSDKFDITKHKRYKELSDYDKKNEFDVEAYMRHRMEVKLTRTQEFDLYAFSEESLAEELNIENKEAEHVKDSDT